MKINSYDKYEYQTVNFNSVSNNYIVDSMNVLGEDGWVFVKDLGNNIWLLSRKINQVVI